MKPHWPRRAALAPALLLPLLLGCPSRSGLDDAPGADLASGAGDDLRAVTTDDGGGAGGDGAAPRDLGADLAPGSSDPFDPTSCDAPALTSAQALARLGAAPRLKLADATLYRRTRSCTGMMEASCGAWGAPVAHTQALLTYSGGVVTDYKTFSFPTHLILFAQAGQPKLVIRHESDYRKDATKDSRGVVFPFGADPMENGYPIIYVWDFAPAPNRYDDLQGLLGDKGQLHAAERCARVVFRGGLTTEIAALYRF